jgi:YfiH family protein
MTTYNTNVTGNEISSAEIGQNMAADLIQKALVTNDWPTIKIENLELLQSPLLLSEQINGLGHAFTTRHGGQTPAPYESFNLGRNVAQGALKADALANRELLCRLLGFNHSRLKVPGQVHSGHVVRIDQADVEPDLSGVDALATGLKEVPLLLHFADCVPVMIYERRKKLLAIAHAGWRGTAQSIVKNAVRTLTDDLGGSPAQMIAAVGPAIGPCCYPTGADVIRQLLDTVSGDDSQNFKGRGEISAALVEERADGSVRPNLKAFNALQLLQSGVSAVDVSNLCTACLPELFYSHRQSAGITGRQGAIACLKL